MMSKHQIKQIHFIEDSDDEIFLAEMLLETQGVQLEIIHHVSFKAFLESPKTSSPSEVVPQLILVDMNMPGTRGNLVVEEILKESRFSDAIIGMCSGSEDPADKRDAIEAGAEFFVQKPLDAECLNHIVELVPNLSLSKLDDGNSTLFYLEN